MAQYVQEQVDPDLEDARALQAGDDDALIRIMRRHDRPLFRYIRCSFNDWDLARELVQETFTKAYFSIRQYDGRGSFKAWLYRIAQNLVKDTLKSRAHRKAGLTTSLAQPENSGNSTQLSALVTYRSPGDELQTSEVMKALKEAIAKLPEELRTPFILCSLEDLSYQECADILRLSYKAVEMRIYKARKRLEETLQRHLP